MVSYWSQMTSFNTMELCQICFRAMACWIAVRSWTNVDLLSVMSYGIYLRPKEMRKMSVTTKFEKSFNPLSQLPMGKWVLLINTLRLRQNVRHFADDISKCISLNEHFLILNKIWLKCVPCGLIENKAALVQIMAWHRTGNKPLSEAMLVCCTDTYMRHSASMS